MSPDDQNSGGFGLRLFKSNTDAYKNDVVPRSTVGAYGLSDDVFGGTPATTSNQSSGGVGAYGLSDDAFSGAFSAEPTKPVEEQGNFSRGFSVSGKQLKQTAYGTPH